jgi:hypothetical protein
MGYVLGFGRRPRLWGPSNDDNNEKNQQRRHPQLHFRVVVVVVATKEFIDDVTGNENKV